VPRRQQSQIRPLPPRPRPVPGGAPSAPRRRAGGAPATGRSDRATRRPSPPAPPSLALPRLGSPRPMARGGEPGGRLRAPRRPRGPPATCAGVKPAACVAPGAPCIPPPPPRCHRRVDACRPWAHHPLRPARPPVQAFEPCWPPWRLLRPWWPSPPSSASPPREDRAAGCTRGRAGGPPWVGVTVQPCDGHYTAPGAPPSHGWRGRGGGPGSRRWCGTRVVIEA